MDFWLVFLALKKELEEVYFLQLEQKQQQSTWARFQGLKTSTDIVWFLSIGFFAGKTMTLL